MCLKLASKISTAVRLAWGQARAEPVPSGAGSEPSGAGIKPNGAGSEPIRTAREPSDVRLETSGAESRPSGAGLEPVDTVQEPSDAGLDPGGVWPEERPPTGKEISKRFKDLIMKDRRGLQKMYGETEAELDESLRTSIERGEDMARKLINEMGCRLEAAIELTVLTLYDVAILIGVLFR